MKQIQRKTERKISAALRLALVAVLLLLAIQRKLQAFFDEPLCYAANGANTHSVCFAYFLKLPWPVVIGLVQLQQGLCMLDLLR